MDWFRHDLNAHDDIKIKKLLKKHGFSALGIYWFLIELICCAGGRLNLNEAIDEVSLIDGLSEKDAEELITNLADMGLVFIEGSMIGSHRSDEEIAYDADRRQKKIDAGRKGGIAKANNAKANSSNATSTSSNATSNASTLPNQTLPIKKREFVSNDTHSQKESVSCLAENSAAYEGINAHDIAPVFKEKFNNIDGIIKCERITVKREIAVSTILSNFSKDEINRVFEKVSNSTFLKGDNDKGWKATFDWLFDIDNFTTVLEGKYDFRKGNSKKAAEKTEEKQDRSEWTDEDEEMKRREEEFVAKWRAKHESDKQS
jgi:hypothetical protein